MARIGRPISTFTRLGAKIAASGRPMYYWSGVTGIAYVTLASYVNGRKDILNHHLYVLSLVFDCEPEELVGLAEGYDEPY